MLTGSEIISQSKILTNALLLGKYGYVNAVVRPVSSTERNYYAKKYKITQRKELTKL